MDRKLPLDWAERAYKWLHRHPELSGSEHETSAFVAAELERIGVDQLHTGIGGNGVCAIIAGSGPGPAVLIRADMDALPIAEATGWDFASAHPGVMHACGHDVHTAVALGAAETLADSRSSWRGTVILVLQPAEENSTGARAMLTDPRFGQIVAGTGKPRVALAQHVAAELPAGQVALLAGEAHAAVDTIDITVHGLGGHGARPHVACDPVVIGAEIVLSLQTIVSRRIPTGERAIITVGRFSSGTKHNIIPDHAELLATVRSYKPHIQTQLLDEIKRIVHHVARAHGAPAEPDIVIRDEHAPAVYNDPQWTDRLRDCFSQLLGDGCVHGYEPSLGAEDFAYFGQLLDTPAVIWRLGAAAPDGQSACAPLHSARFAPAWRPTLDCGIRTMVAAALLALDKA